jgi:hypothetical protein
MNAQRARTVERIPEEKRQRRTAFPRISASAALRRPSRQAEPDDLATVVGEENK